MDCERMLWLGSIRRGAALPPLAWPYAMAEETTRGTGGFEWARLSAGLRGVLVLPPLPPLPLAKPSRGSDNLAFFGIRLGFLVSGKRVRGSGAS